MISGNLFIRDYLLEGIERTDQWKAFKEKDFLALKERLQVLAGKFLRIAKPNEAETEKEFIYPVIEALGWTDYQVQQILSQKGRKQVPDALLFADTAAKSLAVGEAQQYRIRSDSAFFSSSTSPSLLNTSFGSRPANSWSSRSFSIAI